MAKKRDRFLLRAGYEEPSDHDWEQMQMTHVKCCQLLQTSWDTINEIRRKIREFSKGTSRLTASKSEYICKASYVQRGQHLQYWQIPSQVRYKPYLNTLYVQIMYEFPQFFMPKPTLEEELATHQDVSETYGAELAEARGIAGQQVSHGPLVRRTEILEYLVVFEMHYMKTQPEYRDEDTVPKDRVRGKSPEPDELDTSPRKKKRGASRHVRDVPIAITLISDPKTDMILGRQEVRVRDILDPPTALYSEEDVEIFSAISLSKLQDRYALLLDGIRPDNVGEDDAAVAAWQNTFAVGHTLWKGGMQGEEDMVVERAALRTDRDLQTAVRKTMEENYQRPVVDVQIFKRA